MGYCSMEGEETDSGHTVEAEGIELADAFNMKNEKEEGWAVGGVIY